MKRPLVDAIVAVLGESRLTYREIALAINREGSYRPRDGGQVPVAEVRVTVAAQPTIFLVDRTSCPNTVSVRTLPIEPNPRERGKSSTRSSELPDC